MATLEKVVLSASIENEEAIDAWIASIGERVKEVEMMLEGLKQELYSAPHIAINLRRSEP